MKTHQFNRRAFLRGAGVTMALPWMESVNVWGDEPKKNKPASEAPVRLCVTFSGNGFQSKEWWAKGEGKAMELGRVLAPLNEFKEKLLFVRGLYHEEARKGNIHSSQTGNMLSGAPIASGGEIRSGTSFDQLLAQTYGRSTKVPSLVLACEKSNPSVHKNYSMLYSSHISWSSPTTPTPLELYPALAFDRLFKDEASPADKSVLDAVLADAQDLRRDISASDQRKLDEYLDSVRDVEKRIENAGKRGELQGWRPTLDKPNIKRPADGVPQDIGEHMRIMCDLLPDRHHAHHHAEAQQRPQRPAFPKSAQRAAGRARHRLHDPSPSLPQRCRGLSQGEPVLHGAARLHCPQARRHPGRPAHASRQHHAHALLQHDGRSQARQ
jgi:hypothetical protein